MEKIGLFFIVDQEILGKTYEKSEGNHQGNFIIPPEGHDRVWRRVYSEMLKEGYNFYPRGRVAYNTMSKQYVIYHDQCLPKEVLEKVKPFFELSDEQVRYTVDDYYSCHKCNEKIEEDWF